MRVSFRWFFGEDATHLSNLHQHIAPTYLPTYPQTHRHAPTNVTSTHLGQAHIRQRRHRVAVQRGEGHLFNGQWHTKTCMHVVWTMCQSNG